jgi:hypothetical protein
MLSTSLVDIIVLIHLHANINFTFCYYGNVSRDCGAEASGRMRSWFCFAKNLLRRRGMDQAKNGMLSITPQPFPI